MVSEPPGSGADRTADEAADDAADKAVDDEAADEAVDDEVTRADARVTSSSTACRVDSSYTAYAYLCSHSAVHHYPVTQVSTRHRHNTKQTVSH
uniref:hypothetical protein n=1 Tax=Mycolicibacterium palauense TaxID=2034511 RepID=UPI001C3F3411